MSKVRMGMVGGGLGAFIGPVHRMAAELDGTIALVCGAFASDPSRSISSGRTLYGLDPERCYADYPAMFAAEAGRAAHERMQFVTIVTPNDTHFSIAHAALTAGFHVVCDKPVTLTSAEADALALLARKQHRLFAVTYNYSGYPMVKQARDLVAGGALGALRRVSCEYLQGWLATAQERENNKQASWRTDPERAGIAGCFGDIGSHAHHLLEYVSGQRVTSVCAELSRFVDGRRLDDDGNVLLRMSGGAKGVISASQIATGEENHLHLRVYGEVGALQWQQMQPNSLIVRSGDAPTQIYRTGGVGKLSAAEAATRLPPGHPEGYIEAFANLYRNFAQVIAEGVQGGDYPDIADGAHGLRFIEAVVASSAADGQWTSLESNR